MFDDFDVRQELRDLAERAKALHANERQVHLESVALVGELDRRNAAVNMGMTSEAFASFIGLTINQWWKRAQAARVIRFFPKTLEMVNAGGEQVSHLSLLAPRITQANAAVLLAGIKNRSKREVMEVLSCVTHDGQVVDRDSVDNLRLRCRRHNQAHAAQELGAKFVEKWTTSSRWRT